MKLSPTDHAKVLEMIADKYVALLRADSDPAANVILSVGSVSQFSGLSVSQVKRTFPIRAITSKRSGVSLKDYQSYTAPNT